MAEDYRTIAETETDPLAPIVAALMKAFEMNPRAIAAGAPGAPRVEGRALDVHLGTLSLSGTTPAGFTGLDRHSWLRADYVGGSASGTLQARFSNDDGATWGSYQNIGQLVGSGYAGEAPGPSIGMGSLRINLQSGAFRYRGLISANIGGGSGFSALFANSGSGTLTVPSDCNAVQFRFATGSATLTADFDALGGLTP